MAAPADETDPATPAGVGAAPRRGQPEFSRSLQLACLLAVIAPGLIAIAMLWGDFSVDDPNVADDYTITELSLRGVWRGDVQAGVLARGTWRTPGPIQLLWLGPFYFLTGSHAGGLVLGAITWIMLWLGLAWWTATRALRSDPIKTAAVLVAGQGLLGFVADPLNAFMVIYPLIPATLAAAAIARGRLNWIPMFLGAGSVAMQVSFTAIAPLIAIGLVGLASIARTRQWSALPWAGSLVTLGVLWVLPLIDQFAGRGNLFSLFTRSDRSTSNVRPEISDLGTEVARQVTSMPGSFQRWPRTLARLDTQPTWAVVAGVILTLAALVVGLGRRPQGQQRPTSNPGTSTLRTVGSTDSTDSVDTDSIRMVWFLSLLAVAVTAAATVVTPGFRPYYLTPISGFMLAGLLVTTMTADRRLIGAATIAGVAAFAYWGPVNAVADFRAKFLGPSEEVAAVVASVPPNLIANNCSLHLDPVDEAGVYFTVILALELDRLGLAVSTNDHWQPTLGLPGGTADATLAIAVATSDRDNDSNGTGPVFGANGNHQASYSANPSAADGCDI